MEEKINAGKLFAKLAVETKYEDLDEPLKERMRIRFADALGVMATGFHGVGIKETHDFLTHMGGREESSVFNFGGKLPAMNAAFLNALQLRSNDFEPAHAGDKTGKGRAAHITGTMFPLAFALGEREKATGKEIMTAIAVGEDLSCRLCHAMGFSVDGWFDGNGTTNVMGAALCAAKLNKLDEEKTLNALGIALNNAGGPMASTKEHSWLFKYPIANSARNGIFSADMAKFGYEGLRDPILGKGCFMDMFTQIPDLPLLTEDLGKARYGEVLIKPFAGCCATHHSIKACLIATGGKPYRPEEVKEIRVHMLESKVPMVGGIWKEGEASQPFASFSVQATVCNAVLHGRVFPENETPEYLASDEFQAMLKKYNQVTDLKETDPYVASVEVELTDGTILHATAPEVRPGNMTDSEPLSIEYIHDKFIRNMKFAGTVKEENFEKIWDKAMRFDEIGSMDEILDLMISR